MTTWPRVRDRTADLNNKVVPSVLGKQSDYFRGFPDFVKGYINMLLSHFSRVRLCDPIDGSLLGSSVPGILQARTLEWVAIPFSSMEYY